MSDDYFSLSAQPISPKKMELPRAQRLVAAFTASFPYATLVECRRASATRLSEIVIIDVEPEIPQRPVQDIRSIERIAVVFIDDDLITPEVLALRADFPQVPHLNLTAERFLRSLCLFDEPWCELRLRWTPALLITRIREWLTKTARGELHQQDQPLEPILLGSPWTLVLPPELLDGNHDRSDASMLLVQGVKGPLDRYTLTASRLGVQGGTALDADRGGTASGLEWLAVTVRATPQEHGVIHLNPTNLPQLTQLLTPAGVDLRATLRMRLRDLLETRAIEDFLQARLIIIVMFPKTRVAQGDIEAVETWAFLAIETIARVGEEIGLWLLNDGSPGLLLPADDTKHGEAVELQILNPTAAFSRQRAARLNGVGASQSSNIVAIGAGALGSQVFLNLVRAGYGTWTVMDPDVLLPHNLARHALFGSTVGYPKADMVVSLANDIVAGESIARALVVDVMGTSDAAEIASALGEADVIIDMSASVAVSRYVSHDVHSRARRMSLFLNPTGTDGVLLAEDVERSIPLDHLEMQYYRHLVHTPVMESHLSPPVGQVRYGVGCRDHSSSIPQDFVGLHAAIGSRALRAAGDDDRATISIWRYSPETMEIDSERLVPSKAISLRRGDWTILTDAWVLREISRLRASRLPNETGGVLIGSFDSDRRLVYVVDVLPSPPDSQEWPTVYIRGHEGLQEQRERIATVTMGNLDYIGEWHSHPDGHGCEPSSDDQRVLAWLAELRRLDGVPPVLLIVGESDQFGWFIGEPLAEQGNE